MRPLAAACLLAGLLSGDLSTAGCAHAQTAVPFQVVPQPDPDRRDHRWADLTILAGVSLVTASFPLATAADRRYDAYLREGDPARIESRWQAVRRADRLASASLIGGEVVLATGIWLRFLRRPAERGLRLSVAPSRCAVTLRF